MKTLLITGIGGDIAQCAAKIVRISSPDVILFGVDTHSEHGGHLFVDHYFTLPHADHLDYTSQLLKMMETHKVDQVLPMSEAELHRLAIDRVLPASPNAGWLYCGQRALAIGLDKLATAQFVSDIGWPVPWTVLAKQQPLSYPCIFKARRGAGSKQLATVRDEDDVCYLQRHYGDNGVFQELLLPADQEVTCAVYRAWQTGEIRVAQLRRRLTGGFTGWAELIFDPDIERFCKDVVVALDVRGCINIQLIRTVDGPMILEINPRISSTALIRHKMGFCDVAWLLAEAQGNPLPLYQEIAAGVVGVRTQEAVVIRNSATQDDGTQ